MSDNKQNEINLPEAAISAIKNSNNLEAVKIIRQEYALGLREALDLVYDWEKINSQRGQCPVPEVSEKPLLSSRNFSFSIEHLSDGEINQLKSLFKVLADKTIRFGKRAVDISTNYFLVDISDSRSLRDGIRHCILFFNERRIHFSITTSKIQNTESTLYRGEWRGWDGIEEKEIPDINQSFICALAALYETKLNDRIESVLINNYYEDPDNDTLYLFNLRVDAWFSMQQVSLMRDRIKELENGKKSPFKWRFYLARMKPIGRVEITDHFVAYLAPFLKNSKKKALLFKNLDEYGGAGFSADTVRVLNWVRKNNRRIKTIFKQ